MTTSNRVKGRIGVNTVATIVENLWESGWQEYGAPNDDAIDGVILMRKGTAKPADTGGIVFVQVKCGGDGYRRDQKQHPNHVCVALGPEYIAKHRSRWQRVPALPASQLAPHSSLTISSFIDASRVGAPPAAPRHGTPGGSR